MARLGRCPWCGTIAANWRTHAAQRHRERYRRYRILFAPSREGPDDDTYIVWRPRDGIPDALVDACLDGSLTDDDLLAAGFEVDLDISQRERPR